MKYYALYSKNDNYLYSGTAKECAVFMGIAYDSFMKQKKRWKNVNAKIKVYEIEDESIEWIPDFWLLKCVENCSIIMNEKFNFKRNELVNSRIDRKKKYIMIYKNGCILSLPLENEITRLFLKHFRVKVNRWKSDLKN